MAVEFKPIPLLILELLETLKRAREIAESET